MRIVSRIEVRFAAIVSRSARQRSRRDGFRGEELGEMTWSQVIKPVFLTVFVLVPTIFIPRGKQFEAAFEDAKARDEVTPELLAGTATGAWPSRGPTSWRRSPP